MHPEAAAKIAEILNPPRASAPSPAAPASRPFTLADIVQPRFSRAPERRASEPLIMEPLAAEPLAAEAVAVPGVAEQEREVPLPPS